jgi:hypothetical protein
MRPKTSRIMSLTLSLLLIACLACAPKGDVTNTQATPTPVAQQSPALTTPQSETCRMLSAEDVREVQGEAPQEAQGSEHLAGGLSMSQCFYRLPTFSKSVNVELIRGEGGESAAVKEFWALRFHPEAVKKRELEREHSEEQERELERQKERERASGQVREGGHKEKEREGEEEESRPQRVAGLGEDAYWSGNQITGALSVLTRKNAIVRVSLGGPESRDEKIKKASALARKLLNKL